MEEKVTQQTNKEVVNNNETISQGEEKVVSSQQSTSEMTDEELLDNMKSLKVVTNDGQEKELSMAGFQKLVQASLMSIPAGIQARAAVAAATDSMENSLPTATNPQKVRTIDASGNSTITEMSALASVVGGLKAYNIVSDTDFNTLLETGVGRFAGRTDYPGSGIIIVTSNGEYIQQRITCLKNSIIKETIRMSYDSGKKWTQGNI